MSDYVELFDMYVERGKRIAELEAKLKLFVWAENNPSEYVNELEKAQATIERVTAELLATKNSYRAVLDPTGILLPPLTALEQKS